MENNANLIESLFVKLSDFGKTNFELTKLKVLDKSSDVVSSVVPRIAVCLLLAAFLLFLSLGTALWLGELLGKSYWGYFAVAGFWAIAGGVVYFFMLDKLKAVIGDYLVKQAFK